MGPSLVLDILTRKSISILDPHSFTPTLYANLISEILALWRDQEEKTKLIERLESDLHDIRAEHEQLEAALVITTRETRSIKRQLALLEGGTSSALSELARERDEAIDLNTDVKRRLEIAQKKIRAQNEDSDRVHEQWARHKENWDEEKRKYERKIYVAEGRLKTVLEEVDAYQDSHKNGYEGTKFQGVSLADDLDLDKDEDHIDLGHSGYSAHGSAVTSAICHRDERLQDDILSDVSKLSVNEVEIGAEYEKQQREDLFGETACVSNSVSIEPLLESMQMNNTLSKDQDLLRPQPQSTDLRVAATYPDSPPSLRGSPQLPSSNRVGPKASLPDKSPTKRGTFPEYTSSLTIGAAPLPNRRKKRRKLQASQENQQSAFGRIPRDGALSPLWLIV